MHILRHAPFCVGDYAASTLPHTYFVLNNSSSTLPIALKLFSLATPFRFNELIRRCFRFSEGGAFAVVAGMVGFDAFPSVHD